MMRAFIVAMIFFTFAIPAFAQSDGINPEIANCQEIRDPDTQFQVQICSGHAGCALVMGIQKVCTKVKTFLNNLKNFTLGKKSIDSNDVFDAAAQPLEGDAAYNNYSQAIKSNYARQPKKEITNGKFESGVKWVYEGPLKNGTRDGTGVLLTENGSLFRGDFVEGRQAGLGEMSNDKGRKAGIMSGAKIDGMGVERLAGGARYEGEFKVDNWDGKGVWSSATGARYDGTFKNNLQHGRGVFSSGGNQYDGEFLNGERTGQATFTYKNGDHYTGNYLKGKFNGQGTYYWADGENYRGEWLNGEKNGKGATHRADGSNFVGEYRANKAVNGVTTRADGTTIQIANGSAVQPPPSAAPAAAEDSGTSWAEVFKAVGEVAQAYANSKNKGGGGGAAADDGGCGGTGPGTCR